MISQDTKDQIEKEALELYPDMPIEEIMAIGNGFIDTSYSMRVGYIECGTKYAGKLEEKDKEIEALTLAVEGWKEESHNNVDKWVHDRNKYVDLLESKDREIELLTKDIKDQGEYLKQMIEINVLNDAFNSGEEWRKNHKVKEGEQFTDYFMRVFEVEKEDKDHELTQLKEIAEKMINYLKDIERCGECHYCSENAGCAIITYTDWCKQNLK